MCTPGSSDIIICSTVLGSLYLYDLKNIDSNPNLGNRFNYQALLTQLVPNLAELDESKKQQKLQKTMIKYSIQNHSFLTDGLMEFPHFSPIKKLVFISRSTSGISQIGALDEQGVVSVWSIMEM